MLHDQPRHRLLSAGIVFAALLALLLVSSPPGADAGKGPKRTVACFKSTVPGPGAKPRFRAKPRGCVFIAKNALDLQVPNVSSVQATRAIRWRRWGGRRAMGSGKAFVADRKRPIPVRISLSKPTKRCGHKAYSRVKFTFQAGYTKGPLILSTC